MIAEFALSGLLILAFACAFSALGLFFSRKKRNVFFCRISLYAGLCGSLLISAAGLLAILDDNDLIFGLYSLCPGLNLYFGLDRLSGIFIFLLGIVSCAASVYVYSDSGLSGDSVKQNRMVLRDFLMYGFIISLSLVLMSRDIIGFITFWELMAVTSFLLVMYDYENKKSQKAGIYYFAMTQLSTVFVISGFLVLFCFSGEYVFSLLGLKAGYLNDIVFSLLFIGFSIKAGVIPFHKWLPYAHPAAPSAISALMSGVMLNVAVYGLLRVLSDILDIELWWGGVIIIFGLLSAVLGVMYAMKETDIKALLAYSSIENIGIILIGIGLYVLFSALSQEFLASLAIAGALFHAFSHGIVKSLLFMSAGSVVHSTGTSNIDEMGGLIKTMPKTGGLFFTGALSISAIPPLCCFAGELMIFESLFYSFQEVGSYMRLMLFVVLALLALSSAMSASCFVKAFGISFLGLPRSKEAGTAHEEPLSAFLGSLILAGVAVLTGVFSEKIMNYLGFSGYLPDMLSVSLILLALMAFVYAALNSVKHPPDRVCFTWDCGIRRPASRIEYTAAGFAEPLVTIFSAMFRTKKYVEKDYYDSDNCVFKSGTAGVKLIRFFEEYIYAPLGCAIERFAGFVSRIQNGSLDTYLLYLFITVVSVIILLGLMS